MRRTIAIVIGLAMAACSGSTTCTNATHLSCDVDAGSPCAAPDTCVSALDAIDPCPTGATGCCFQPCTQDSDCPDGMSCPQGYCAAGRCIDDGGF